MDESTQFLKQAVETLQEAMGRTSERPMRRLLDWAIDERGTNGTVQAHVVFSPGHSRLPGGLRRHPDVEGCYCLLAPGQDAEGNKMAIEIMFTADAVQSIEVIPDLDAPNIVTPDGGPGGLVS